MPIRTKPRVKTVTQTVNRPRPKMPSQMDTARATYPPAEKLARIPTPSPLAKIEKRRKCSLQQYDFPGDYLGARSQSSHSYLPQEQKSNPLLYILSPAPTNTNCEERDFETRRCFFGRLRKSALFFFPLPSARTPAQLGYRVCL